MPKATASAWLSVRLDPGGGEFISYGHLAEGDLRQLDGHTVFEIGSITKVFTALLLADMARRGEFHSIRLEFVFQNIVMEILWSRAVSADRPDAP